MKSIQFLAAVSLFFLTIAFTGAQTSEEPLDRSVAMEPGNYKLGEIAEKIYEASLLKITYNGNLISSEGNVTVTRKNPSIRQLLENIRTSLSVSYTLKNSYIILEFTSQSESIRISGRITDKVTNEPLSGANIIVINTPQGTTSNHEGLFELILGSRSHELRISFIGYRSAYVDLNQSTGDFLSVALLPDSNLLSAVTITSRLRKFYNLDLGRPLETIGAKAIENTSINNVSDILNGRFAGVWATQTSGLPGDHQRVHIRGVSSIFGSVDPLYVIDGVSVPMVNLHTLGIGDLNAHDVENITILKDASSTALFGFQGANGVVLIDTRHGKKKRQLTFYTKQGIQWFSGRYDLMGTKDFLASLDSSYSLLGINIRMYYPEWSDTLSDTDWQDHIFQTGQSSEFQLSGSGTVMNTGYYISGNYLRNEGIISQASYTRYTLTGNIERSLLKKLSLELGYRGSIQQNQNNLDGYGGNQVLFEGINKSPCQLSTHDTMYYRYDPHLSRQYFAYRIYQEYNALNSPRMIDSVIMKTRKALDITSNMFRGALKYDINEYTYVKFTSDLSLRRFQYLTNIGADNFPLRGTYITNSFLPPDISYIKSNENIIVLNNMLNLKWERKIGDHGISLYSGLKMYKDLVYWNSIVRNARGYTDQEYNVVDVTDGAYIRNSMSINGPQGNAYRNLNSILGNFNYHFRSKYFVSLAGNYENLREGIDLDHSEFFPSVSLNWDIARERFLQPLLWLNSLNLYSSWGKSGNYPLNGLSSDLYSLKTAVYWNNVIDSGRYVQQLANHSLKQEIVAEYNLGIYVDLFRNSRLTARIDYYHKLNHNLIMLREVPGYYGGGKMFYNVGEIETRGKEITIEIIPVLTGKASWYSKFNFTTYSQSVKKLDLDSSIRIINYSDILMPSFIIEQGMGLGDIYGYQYLGRWTKADEESRQRSYINVRGYKFLNADSSNNILDVNDMVIIGNSMPKLIMNWYHSVTWRNLTLDMLWYAVLGADKYNSTRAATYVAGTNRELNALIIDTIGAHSSPSISGAFDHVISRYAGIMYQSSYFVEDASFIRLKQISLSWAPEKAVYRKIHMKMSLILENMVTLTRYKGYDPETSIYTDNNFSDNAIDRGAFPNPQSIYISLTFNY